MPFADPVAVPGEHGAPGEGAERGNQGKHAESHADDARRDGDQVADDGEKARKKDPGHFITLQEKFRLFHLVGRHEKEFAPAHDDRAADNSGHHVGNGGPQPGAEGPGKDDAPEAHGGVRLGGKNGRGGNDHLAGHGKNGAFHGHENDDARISPVLDPGHPKCDQLMHTARILH